MERLDFDHLQPETASRYGFYTIPKLIVDNKFFNSIDYGAKILYSLMLNQAISEESFVDDNGDLYIIYTVEQVMEDIRCSNKTAVKMLKQLDDIGLIERKKQEQGKSSIIYVKDIGGVK